MKITFYKSGTNDQNAVTGQVKLIDGSETVIVSDGFSGGKGYRPLDDGTYRLRLDVRGDESTNKAKANGELEPFYGIQRVGNDVVDANGIPWDMQVEWGTLRARLNPSNGAEDHGDYLHGKHRALDWTHGCICERSEAILNYLWNLSSPPAVIDVEVSGGEKPGVQVHSDASKAAGQIPAKARRVADPSTSISITVSPPPPPVAQSKSNSCWAAVTGIVFGWRTGIAITDEEAARQLGPNYRLLYEANEILPASAITDWVHDAGLQELPPANLTVGRMVQELSLNKPLVAGILNGGGGHLVVAVALEGDESPAGTDVSFIDPDGGSLRSLTFTDFQRLFESIPNGPAMTQLFRVL